VLRRLRGSLRTRARTNWFGEGGGDLQNGRALGGCLKQGSR